MNKTGEEQAIVIELKNKNEALVELKPSSACGSCNLCAVKPLRITVENKKNALVGDTVMLNTNKFKKPIIVINVYVMPVVFLILGYFIGSMFYDKLSLTMDKESFSATIAALFFASYIIIAIVITKKHRKLTAAIVEIIQNSNN